MGQATLVDEMPVIEFRNGMFYVIGAPDGVATVYTPHMFRRVNDACRRAYIQWLDSEVPEVVEMRAH